MSFPVEGCIYVSTFFIRPNQYLYLVAERHDTEGNPTLTIQTLLQKLDCPLDVIFEKAFQVREKSSSFVKGKSNIVKLQKQLQINKYLFRDTVPKDKDLLLPKNKPFFDLAIKPYQGKLKLWASDARGQADFRLFEKYFDNPFMKNQIDIYHDNKLLLNVIDLIRKYQFAFLDLHLFKQDRDKYDQQIKFFLFQLFELIYSNQTSKIQKIKTQFIQNISLGQKGSKDILERLLKIVPESLILQWVGILKKRIIQDPAYAIYGSSISDLNTLLTFFKIINRQSSGILLGFFGESHVNCLSDCLTITFPNPKTYFPKKSTSTNLVMLPLSELKCKDKTLRMKAYDYIMNSKK